MNIKSMIAKLQINLRNIKFTYKFKQNQFKQSKQKNQKI